MDNDSVVSTLNHLIAIAKDGAKGMDSAAEAAKSPTLKTTLQRLSRERNQVATKLQDTVRRLGGNPDDSGTVLGSAHRAFLNVKQAVTGDSDQALVEECERGEDVAVREFQQAIDKGMPGDIAQTVQSCFGEVRKSHDEVRRLKHQGVGP